MVTICLFFCPCYNLACRRGEEHSFILKPVTSMWKSIKVNAERSTIPSQKKAGNVTSNLGLVSKTVETKKNPTMDQYAINVSCRCNYTGNYIFLCEHAFENCYCVVL